jgi:hypothetical protein
LKRFIELAGERVSPAATAVSVLAYGARLIATRYPYRHQRISRRLQYRQFFQAFLQPRRSAFVTIFVPSELLIALGLTPLMLESVGAVIGAFGFAPKFLRAASEMGLPSSLCTFHRAYLSFAHLGGFPPPRVMLAISALCDGNLRSLQEMNHTLSSRLYFIDCPVPGKPGSEAYLAEQLAEVFNRIARAMGVSRPTERLRDTVRRAEQTRRWMIRANEARRGRYLPREPLGLASNLGIQTMLIGSAGLLRFYRILYNDLMQKGVAIPKSKHRILLMHLLPMYDHPVISRLFTERCIIAAEEYTYLPWPELDPAEPFRSIARRLLSQPQMSDPERRIDLVNRMIDEYAIDGVVHLSHWGCRQSSGAIHSLRRYVKRPLLNLETDLVDPESSSSGQLSTRIEGFLEMLESQRSLAII